MHGVKNMIFFASVAGLYGKPEHSGYSASKSGVISLVQSLGMEGYNAYAISAGRVHTKMREKDFPNEDPKTRLLPKSIGKVVKEILNNKYKPGNNVIIRKRGYRILRRVDKGSGWAEYLRVGQPPVC
jgi:NAD(P)-dependent dehydrogenase (short-subunit alcohol dehydrogenase family)